MSKLPEKSPCHATYFFKSPFFRFLCVIILWIVPSMAGTRYLTHHTLIDSEIISFQSFASRTASGVLTISYNKDSKVFSGAALKSSLKQVANKRLEEIASQIFNINNIYYDLCSNTPTYVAFGSEPIHYIGDTNSLEVILQSYRTDPKQVGSYVRPMNEIDSECLDFGNISDNNVDFVEFPRGNFFDSNRANIRGYAVINLALDAILQWQIAIFTILLIFIGNLWLVIFAAYKFVQKGILE